MELRVVGKKENAWSLTVSGREGRMKSDAAGGRKTNQASRCRGKEGRMGYHMVGRGERYQPHSVGARRTHGILRGRGEGSRIAVAKRNQKVLEGVGNLFQEVPDPPEASFLKSLRPLHRRRESLLFRYVT